MKLKFFLAFFLFWVQSASANQLDPTRARQLNTVFSESKKPTSLKERWDTLSTTKKVAVVVACIIGISIAGKQVYTRILPKNKKDAPINPDNKTHRNKQIALICSNRRLTGRDIDLIPLLDKGGIVRTPLACVLPSPPIKWDIGRTFNPALLKEHYTLDPLAAYKFIERGASALESNNPNLIAVKERILAIMRDLNIKRIDLAMDIFEDIYRITHAHPGGEIPDFYQENRLFMDILNESLLMAHDLLIRYTKTAIMISFKNGIPLGPINIILDYYVPNIQDIQSPRFFLQELQQKAAQKISDRLVNYATKPYAAEVTHKRLIEIARYFGFSSYTRSEETIRFIK